MEIHAFDFDGTLTRSDSLLGIIRHQRGTAGLMRVLLMHAPNLLMMKAGRYPNWKVKQKVFRMCFGGMTLSDFNALCEDYAKKHLGILRAERARGHRDCWHADRSNKRKTHRTLSHPQLLRQGKGGTSATVVSRPQVVPPRCIRRQPWRPRTACLR